MSCPYFNEEKDSVMSGIYCNNRGRVGVKFWDCYCKSNWDRCPYYSPSGDDPYELDYETVRRKREEEQRKREEEQRRKEEQRRREEEQAMMYAERQKEDEERRRNAESTKESSSTTSSYDDYDSYENLDDFDSSIPAGRVSLPNISAGVIFFLLIVVAAVVLWFGATHFGWLGPWVEMQLPSGTDSDNYSLYSLGFASDTEMKVNSENFKKDGICKLYVPVEFGEIYIQQDDASVWLGMSHLYTLNTAIVEDISFDEIQSQMVRTLIIQLQETDGTELKDVQLKVTDVNGTSLNCVQLEAGQYAVIFPNDTKITTVLVEAEGYETLSVEADMSERLVRMLLTLEKTGGKQ